MRIGDAEMGQEIMADSTLTKNREIRVRTTLQGDAPARVVLMRNGEPFAEQAISKEDATSKRNEIVFQDRDSLDAITNRGSQFHSDPFVVYYARIESGTGEQQWTSPIWIDLS